jgi:signal transduction histidine kinase
MLELALHILDIAENSVRAMAKTVLIEITENRERDRLCIVIRDDGKGMSKAVLDKAMDPFYTSKKVRRVGLGLPMLEEAARRAGGGFAIESQEGQGTRLAVEFQLSHIDRQPLGDITGPDCRKRRRGFCVPAPMWGSSFYFRNEDDQTGDR